MSDKQSGDYDLEDDLKALALHAAQGQLPRLKKKRGRPKKRVEASDQTLNTGGKRLPQSYRLREGTVRSIDQLLVNLNIERTYEVIECAVSLCELMLAAGYDVPKLANRFEKAKILTTLAAEFGTSGVPVVNLTTLISDAKLTS